MAQQEKIIAGISESAEIAKLEAKIAAACQRVFRTWRDTNDAKGKAAIAGAIVAVDGDISGYQFRNQ